MGKDSLIEGPAEVPSSPTTKPSGSKTYDGEAGYKKRVGGRFPEVNRDVNNRFPKPTKR